MTVAKTSTLDLNTPAVYEPKWEIYVNQNWDLVDLEFQKYALELIGDSTDPLGGINDLSTKYDEFDDTGYIDDLNLYTIESNISEATVSTDVEVQSELPDASFDSKAFVGTTSTPLTKVGVLITVTDALMYAAIGNRQYKIQQLGLSWTVADATARDYMIVVGNYDFSDLAATEYGEAVYGPERTSYASEGFMSGTSRLATSIGSTAKVGDTLRVNDHEYWISVVTTDEVTVVSHSGGEPTQIGPDDVIYGQYEPWIGVIEYDADLLMNPNLLVIATVVGDALKFNHLASSFRQKLIKTDTAGSSAGTLVTIALPANTSSHLMPLNFSKRIVMDETGANEEIIFRCSGGINGQGTTVSILNDVINAFPIGILGSMGNRALISGTIQTNTYDSCAILTES